MSDTAKAIALILTANAMYGLGYALAKVMSGALDPVQITFLRSSLVLLAAAPFALAARTPGRAIVQALVPPRAWAQRAAAAMLILSTCLGVWAYALLPVTEAAALGFTGPLILAASGALLLRERVGLRGWVAVALGFAGMLVIVRPGSDVFSPAAIVPIFSALTYALYQVMARRLRGTMGEWGATVQAALAGIVLLGPPMLVLWRPVSLETAFLVALFAVVQTGGLASLAGAVRRADVSRLAPWHYSRLAFALLLDMLMFDRTPPLAALAGGALIVGGGLVSLRRKATPTSPPATRSPPAPPTRG